MCFGSLKESSHRDGSFEYPQHVVIVVNNKKNGYAFFILLGLEPAIDPPPPRGNFVHYDFLKLHYIRHRIKDVSPLRVATLTCNITLYTLPPQNSIKCP